MAKYRFLPHTADIKVAAEGSTMEEAFGNAALALREVICGDVAVESGIAKRVQVSGKDPESLLYAFLEEFLFLLDAEGFLLSEVQNIRITGDRLFADVAGDTAHKYDFANSVKAITYNEMFVRHDDTGWHAQFVLDV